MALPTGTYPGAYLQQLTAAHRVGSAAASDTPELSTTHLCTLQNARRVFHVARRGAAQDECRQYPCSGQHVEEAAAAQFLRQLVIAPYPPPQLVRALGDAPPNSRRVLYFWLLTYCSNSSTISYYQTTSLIILSLYICTVNCTVSCAV